MGFFISIIIFVQMKPLIIKQSASSCIQILSLNLVEEQKTRNVTFRCFQQMHIYLILHTFCLEVNWLH